MNKKKVICNSVLLGLAIVALIGMLRGYGFNIFDLWQNLEAFKYSFFAGMAYLYAPILLIATMLLIVTLVYNLLRVLNVVKANKFDKAFEIIKMVVFGLVIVSVVFTSITYFVLG